jgi:glycosyltransferase involved in cell wall biosynthesis
MKTDSLSAFVVSYNRAEILSTVLYGLSFVDEIIVVDKSSTDGSAKIASLYADRVITVPWSPTVESTRRYALEQCRGTYVLFLDDDECLNPALIHFLSAFAYSNYDIISFPLRHYIIGQHSANAYYWPERHDRMFRRGALEFGSTVHGGIQRLSDNVFEVPFDTGAAIEHFSHESVTKWIEKTNRYTSQAARVRALYNDEDLVSFAHKSIDDWQSRTRNSKAGSYEQAVALLRSTYDIIDRLKSWEAMNAVDGARAFASACTRLQDEYKAMGLQPRVISNGLSSTLPEANEDTEPDERDIRPRGLLSTTIREPSKEEIDSLRAELDELREYCRSLEEKLVRGESSTPKRAFSFLKWPFNH